MTKNKKQKTKKRIKAAFIAVFIMCCVLLAALIYIDFYIRNSVAEFIVTAEDAAVLDADCILVLGAGVRQNGEPSDMLRDRLDISLELFFSGASDRLLMSGDHGSVDYDEVNTMKSYAVKAAVPSECVFMDHAGFSTYESMYRAKAVFCAEKIIIVTQEYHLYRALYVAKSLGLEAYGVAADRHVYAGQAYRDVREILARAKDFAMCVIKPLPTYLGDAIPVSGDGNVTNDNISYAFTKQKIKSRTA